ncbi:MAG: hypothetical protein JSS86_01765 [Cyanobacteria bacterium SZAS LIN-2]|nr:hypothetical protein [Cyanobacteria bacterium SZAS LIN-2]
MAIFLLITQVASTWFMTGLIWFVQIVHYPLYNRVGVESFVEYERQHCALTTMVVAPVMVVELLTAILLVVARPKAVGLAETLIGVALLGVIWISTLFIADNLHGALSAGFNFEPYRQLLASNWLRTACWTLRGLLVLYMCYRSMQS